MEGIRRIGLALKGLAVLWAVALLGIAIVDVIGTDVPMTYDEKVIAYRDGTGRNATAEAEVNVKQRGSSTGSLADSFALAAEEDRLMQEYFSGHPAVVRKRDWTAAGTCAFVVFIGSGTLWTLGWIISGFAVKRPTQ